MFSLRVIAVWSLIIGVEVAHGIARAIFLTPHVGDLRSRQIGVFTGSLLIVLIASLTARWLHAEGTTRQILTGFTWTLLTLAFEFGFGHFVLDMPFERLCADYNIRRGGLLPFGLLVLALSPWIAAQRLRGADLLLAKK